MKSWSTSGTYGRGYAVLSNDGDTHGYGDEASCTAIGNEAMIWYKNVRSLAPSTASVLLANTGCLNRLVLGLAHIRISYPVIQ